MQTLGKQLAKIVSVHIAVIVTIMTLIHTISISVQLEDEAQMILELDSSIELAQFEGWLDSNILYLEAIKASMEANNGFEHLYAFDDYFAKLLEANPYLVNILIGTQNGDIVSAKEIDDENYDPRNMSWYKGASEVKGLYISEPYFSIASKEQVISMSMPITNPNKDIVGVIAINISVDVISETIDDLSGLDDVKFFIMNESFQIISHNNAEYNPDEEGLTLVTDIGDYESLRDNPEGTIVRTADAQGNKQISVYTKVPFTTWKIVASYPTSMNTSTVYFNIIMNIVIGIAAVLIGRSGLIAATSRYISPLEEGIGALTQLKYGKLDIDTSHIDVNSEEMEVFVESINDISYNLKGYINEISTTLEQYSEGNFVRNCSNNYVGDFIVIDESLEEISVKLKDLLVKIAEAGVVVGFGSTQISDGASLLAEATMSQLEMLYEFKNNVRKAMDNMNSVDENERNEAKEQLVKLIEAVLWDTDRLIAEIEVTVVVSEQNYATSISLAEHVEYMNGYVARFVVD
ncbi:MAG: hypothetical protein ATN34_01625 [Epulopiscium sp. Nele67-Bin002]|nr:MAG: hypothetical protein ATN34_01625 [Epulopiscium sp. Nele67-Bin002]